VPARSVLEVTARLLIEAGRRKPREVEPVDKGELMSAAPISAEALFNEISNELRTKFHLNLALQNNRQYVHGVRNIADYIAKQEASGDYTIELTREGPRTLRIGVKVDGGTEFGHTIHVDGLAYPLRKDRTMERAGGQARTHDFSERHTLSDGTNVGIQVSKTKVGDGMKWWVRVYTEDQRGESADLALNSISSARAKQIIMRTRFMKGKLSGIPAKQRKKVLQSFTVESLTPQTVVSRLLEDDPKDELLNARDPADDLPLSRERLLLLTDQGRRHLSLRIRVPGHFKFDSNDIDQANIFVSEKITGNYVGLEDIDYSDVRPINRGRELEVTVTGSVSSFINYFED